MYYKKQISDIDIGSIKLLFKRPYMLKNIFPSAISVMTVRSKGTRCICLAVLFNAAV